MGSANAQLRLYPCMAELRPYPTPMTPSELHRYRDALSDWLGSYDWQYFATFTSAYQRSPRSWRRFMEQLQNELLFDRVFWGCEADDTRPHVHALLSSTGVPVDSVLQERGWGLPGGKMFGLDDDAEAFLIWRFAAERNGLLVPHPDWPGRLKFRYGRTDVQGYDRERGASYYVGKYVTKELNDYDLWTHSAP